MTSLYIMLATVIVFALLAFAMYGSIKKHEAKPKAKAKKGRNRYMPQVKNPGK